ncbi:hypothetical protein QTG54_004999 [Skeletonema marinoi]|uniref:Uncharacterized protein n=1 Tax=Skeletonema marinoi TaxID=267567 RepID=A0AAD8YG15_9STRA|nr:hypothetical protein QTG54_004999 [Skeletonema marinoi]
MNGGGGNYSPGGGGGTSNNRGQNFGGNPGQRNSLDYMRALNEAQYGGGVEYLQSPLGRHLAMQQEIELRRRQVEEQHLISELEYQNQLRRLQHQQQIKGSSVVCTASLFNYPPYRMISCSSNSSKCCCKTR